MVEYFVHNQIQLVKEWSELSKFLCLNANYAKQGLSPENLNHRTMWDKYEKQPLIKKKMPCPSPLEPMI